jgi:hypothetical protein
MRLDSRGDPDVIDRAELRKAARRYGEALGKMPPEFDDKLREEAAHALRGEVHYTDGTYVAIGRSGIDYTGSHIANHVWKERPKRFLWFPALMAGYAVTGDESYAEAARDYLADWMRVHPASPGWAMPRYDNGLNLAVRVAFFAEAAAVFSASPAWDDAFLARVLGDVAGELGYIGSNLSPRGNFRMKQAMTLIECGLRLPMMPGAAGWRRLGAAVMNDAARRQILPDGVHAECNPGYHAWMTLLLGDCLCLGKAWPDLGFAFSVETVSAMHNYSMAATRPNGSLCGLHDSEGAWEGSRQNVARERREAFRRFHRLPGAEPPPSQVFSQAGQAFLRDGWGEEATYLTFDATRWGGAHCHLSRNSIQLHAHGRSLLVDPGRISYEMSDPLGPYAKSTRAHNTLSLNGWNQFTVNPDGFRHFHASGFDCVSSRYSGGYWPGRFGWWFSGGLGQGLAAVHARHLFWVHGRWALVIDEITRWNEAGRGPEHESPGLEVNWQLSPGRVEADAARRRVHTCHADANLLLAFVQAPAEAVIETHEGETDPQRGWIRDMARFGGIPAPQVSLTCRPWKGHMEILATLLVPYPGSVVPDFKSAFTPGDAMGGKPSGLTLDWPDGTRETVNWTTGLETMLGACGDGATDGVLLYRRQGPDPAAASVDATYADGSGPAQLLKGQGA